MSVTDAKAILEQMQALGSEQARKTYQRHGVGASVYGVSYADLGKLQKKLKVDQPLALALWASGVHDARVLALMIADPLRADAAKLEAWVKTLDNYVITDAFSTYVARTALAQAKAEAWIRADHEWIGSAGWNLVAALAKQDDALPDAFFAAMLATVERDLAQARNRTRHAMNSALIAIGGRNPALQASALAAARRIGKVVVDHGLTNCKTRDAVTLLQAPAAGAATPKRGATRKAATKHAR